MLVIFTKVVNRELSKWDYFSVNFWRCPLRFIITSNFDIVLAN